MSVPREGNRTNNDENKKRTTKHVPTGEIAVIQVGCNPTCQEVVGKGQRKRCANGIVCPDISENCEFCGYLHVRPEETTEKFGEGATIYPLVDRVKDLFTHEY